MGLLNKATKYASSPEGRRTISSVLNRGTAGRRTTGVSGTGRGAPMGGTGGGMLGKVASSFLRGRRR